MLLRDLTGRSVEFQLIGSNGVDWAEDWLNAGSLPRDEDGAYLVDDIDYVNGCNSDIDGKIDAELVVF